MVKGKLGAGKYQFYGSQEEKRTEGGIEGVKEGVTNGRQKKWQIERQIE